MARISEGYQKNKYNDIDFNYENIAFVPEDYAYKDDGEFDTGYDEYGNFVKYPKDIPFDGDPQFGDPQDDYEDDDRHYRDMGEMYGGDVGLLQEYSDPSSKVSKKELWNLKMDIEGLKKKVTDVQNTASDMPREYVKKICDFQSYPFETPISVDQDLNNWCSEVDDFIDDSLNFDDKNKYYVQSLRGGKGREYTGMLAESKLFRKILRTE